MGITFNFDLKLDYEAVSTVDGNGLLREILFEIGSDTILDFEWTLPDGDTYTGEASFALQSIGGEATAIDGGSVEAIVLGKPEKKVSASS